MYHKLSITFVSKISSVLQYTMTSKKSLPFVLLYTIINILHGKLIIYIEKIYVKLINELPNNATEKNEMLYN
jgi:hypothetical protein